MFDDRSILLIKPIGDGVAFGEDFVVEFDWLVWGTVDAFAGNATDDVSEFRWIILKFSVLKFLIESFASRLISLIPDLLIQDLDLRISRVGGAKSIALASSFHGTRR